MVKAALWYLYPLLGLIQNWKLAYFGTFFSRFLRDDSPIIPCSTGISRKFECTDGMAFLNSGEKKDAQ